jgi:hypothetical protein
MDLPVLPGIRAVALIRLSKEMRQDFIPYKRTAGKCSKACSAYPCAKTWNRVRPGFFTVSKYVIENPEDYEDFNASSGSISIFSNYARARQGE